MGQTWTTDCFAKGHAYDTDMGNIETNFATLKSLFSGTSQPSNTVAGMPWFDTTNKVLKLRNAANSAWIGLMHGDGSQKMWVYRDSAMDGWTVDSSVTDSVLAVKGGTTYTTGAATAGSWTISALTHNHQWHTNAGSEGTDTSWQSNGSSTIGIYSGSVKGAGTGIYATVSVPYPAKDMYTKNNAPDDDAFRPAAAVGTLQYLAL